MPTKKARVVAGKKRREPSPESTNNETNKSDVIDVESKASCVPAAKKVFCLTSVHSFDYSCS